MLTWPDKPLIRIIRGREYGEPIDGSLAVREDPGGEYLLVSGPRAKNTVDPACTRTDSIDDWEEVTAVPSAALKRLRDEFRGAPISERRLAVLLEVTSSLKQPAPSPLGQAVARVSNLLEGPRTLLDTSSDRYLSQLLRSLHTLQEVEHEPGPREEEALATIVRICVSWVAEIAPPGSRYGEQGESGILAEVGARAESDPDVGGFLAMTALAGDAAGWIDGARESGTGPEELFLGLSEPVIHLAHYALALLAKTLKGGERDGRTGRASSRPLQARRRLRRRAADRDGREVHGQAAGVRRRGL